MKLLKKLVIASIAIMAILLLAPKLVPELKSAYTVEAASVKINKTKKTIYEGNTYTLKVTGTKKTVKWSSSDKSVAKVNSKGKVTAIKNGKATITAKVGNKKLKCKVNVKLLQFDSTFYTLEETAKAYRDVTKIKNYKDFHYDLDGDGKKDEILIKHLKDSDDYDYQIQLNGKTFCKGYSWRDIHYVYIVDLNKNDKSIEVVVFGNGPSDDPNYEIYSKKGSKMEKVGEMGGCPFRFNKKGTIVCSELYINPRIYGKYYQIKNGKLSNKKFDAKDIKDVKFKTTDDSYFTESMENLENGIGDGTKEALEEVGIYQGAYIFYIQKINYNYGKPYLLVKLDNGKKGYLLVGGWFAG